MRRSIATTAVSSAATTTFAPAATIAARKADAVVTMKTTVPTAASATRTRITAKNAVFARTVLLSAQTVAAGASTASCSRVRSVASAMIVHMICVTTVTGATNA